MQDIISLYNFINRAENERKYAPSTATSYRVVLNKFRPILKPEEKSSVELIANRLDAILREVSLKYPDVTSGSLRVYGLRFQRVLRDFQKYANDPVKMADWKTGPKLLPTRPRVIKSTPKNTLVTTVLNNPEPHQSGKLPTLASPSNSNASSTSNATPVETYPLTIRHLRSEISIPLDITKQEADRLVKFAQFISSLAKENS